ncbi:uncharacterized protein RHOBADRAFT_52726 [Rhodotorula graminis WP1]|uniref:Uncharacterized protein n=1 Tax=Rhodotorula graminis (strain WP1) TaxID=578459 RepID=A0A194S8G1_RHOGW|nr:uncharacterized protein RHOBADRAFT_52726 [Rhodotorula graminis WP1]KPV75691.1 hypothetical protein RHOBADRAFT_52726 [Rhodotorula graminis WP1]
MTDHCTLTVHTFHPVPPSLHLDPALIAQRTHRAQRLVRSLWDSPATAHSAPACRLDPPLEPLAGTKSYSSAPPPEAAPRILRSAHPRPATTPISPRQLPAFSHWTGSPSSSPPPPPPAPAPARSNKRRASSPQPAPTQGILKKHPRVAGAWSDAPSTAPGGGAAPGRERKRVRVESPRSSEAKAAARRASFGLGGAGSAGGDAGPSAGSSRARELVPPTPPMRPVFVEPAEREEKEEREEEEPERPDLAREAIQRCIPYPYAQPARPPRPGEAPNPARQHPARVLHSFVDPLWTSAPIAVPLSRTATTSASTLTSQTQTQTHGGAHSTSSLPLDSPATLAALAPGRRGAWLLPLSGPLPSFVASSSPSSTSSSSAANAAATTAPAVPAFFARPPHRRRRSSSTSSTSATSTTSSRDAHGHRRLEWTDARVRAVWDCVAQLGAAGGAWGVVRCDAWWPPDEVEGPGDGGGRGGGGRGEGAAGRARAGRGGAGAADGGPSAWPALLRIACPAHLALALRGLLAQVSVSALVRAARRRTAAARSEGGVRAGEGGEEDDAGPQEGTAEDDSDEEDDDDDRFLRGRRLVWVDEEGAPVLIA